MNKYICINCGNNVKALCKQYSLSVLKLISCENCRNVADKYVEYDPIIIIIDLVLLSKEAYRHILYNTEFKIHWKLAIMLLIMEAYTEYILTTSNQTEHLKEINKEVNLDYFRTGDVLFYKIFSKTVFRLFCFICVVLILTKLYKRVQTSRTQVEDFSPMTIWKGLTLSSFGIFLLLPSLIWSGNDLQDIYKTLVYLYTTLSQLLVYTVVCNCPKIWSIVVIMVSHCCKIYSVELLRRLEVQCLCLLFCREVERRISKVPSVLAVVLKNVAEIKFRETVDALDQIKFRRYYQRICRPNESEVITIQDVKDVALFIADTAELTVEFINYFHIPIMDRFLRALIIYFQYYIQVWENMIVRREEEKRKLWQPIVTELENVVRDDLSDLRSMVAREYCAILVGMEDAHRFHHMNNKNSNSLSEKERKFFETTLSIACRVVWIGLQRKYFSLIETEMARLLRSDIFNLALHRGIRGGMSFTRQRGENRVLRGTADKVEKKLLQRSPAVRELILANHDHRMLAIGLVEIQPSDERLRYLEAAYAAPEELLLDLKITIGILGLPRKELDAMLLPKERTSEDINKLVREMPPFKLPPRVDHKDQEMPKTFPQKPCKYKETAQTLRAREEQRKVWLDHLLPEAQSRSVSISE